MQMNVNELEVMHNESEQHFEIQIDNLLCELDYRLEGNTMIIYHTGVPSPLEGQGIAGRLTQAALEYAERQSLKVVPLCSYAAAYIHRHPQYNGLVKHNDQPR